MGSQRRLAEMLLDRFQLTEERAYELVPLFEAVELGDAISDALYLVEHGQAAEGFRALRLLQRQLATNIDALEAQIQHLKIRL